MNGDPHIVFQVVDYVYKKMTSAGTWIFCVAISMLLAWIGALIR